MRTLKEFIFDTFTPSETIFEMATISKAERWGNNTYRIAVHGTASGDRETPKEMLNKEVEIEWGKIHNQNDDRNVRSNTSF